MCLQAHVDCIFPESSGWFQEIKVNARVLKLSSHEFFSRKFDFFRPDYSYSLEPKSVVLTFGGLEQIGSKFEPIMKYFLSQSNVRFIHLEPFVETYARNDVFSELGYQYALKRNYLNGFLRQLKELKKRGEIELELEVCLLGSAFHDG